MKRPVIALSCTLTGPPMATRRLERTVAVGVEDRDLTSSPQPKKYETAYSSPVSGSRLGCAVYPPSSVPPKSHGPIVSSSSVSS